MSEYINNREVRQNAIKEILKQLHEGKSVEEVKSQFEDAFQGVSASEISAAEAALIADGLPVDEVQKLCDVHAAVFKGSIEEIHQPSDPKLIAGHPLNILYLENRKIEEIIQEEIRPYLEKSNPTDEKENLLAGIEKLAAISVHYKKKENLFFPYMEKYGITAPPKVMWGVDDEIREQIKTVKSAIIDAALSSQELIEETEAMLTKVSEMIFKEENIMTPMLLEHLTLCDWKIIDEGMPEIGYLINKVPMWNSEQIVEAENETTANETTANETTANETAEKNGSVILVEHKTTSEDIEITSDYWLKLMLDGQISQYYLGAKALGYEVTECLYDVIRKPSMRPYSATPEESRKYKKDGTLYETQHAFDDEERHRHSGLRDPTQVDGLQDRQTRASDRT